MSTELSYRDWYIPFRYDDILLRDAHHSLQQVGASANEVPMIVRLVENPRVGIPGLDIFHGAVELEHHDYIHIVLGRGLLAVDEAFTIGFTMGSTGKVTTSEERLYSWIARNLYPKSYKFTDNEIEVFKDAVRLGAISHCRALDTIEFEPFLDMSLREVRRELAIEPGLMLAYYEIEKQRYPSSLASQRLLDEKPAANVMATF